MSIVDLAEKTNIRTTVLIEIEANNFVNCGGQTYARGHLRTISKVLGIDQAEILRIFDEEQGSDQRTMQEQLVENSVMRQPQENRKVSWKTLVIISVVSLALVGVVQIIISNTPKNIAETSAAQESIAPSRSASPSATPTAQPSAQNTFSTGTGVTVVVSTPKGKSWLFVSDSQGRTLFSGQLAQGLSKVFSSDTQLNLKIGNAGGVDLTVNGKKIASIGAVGEVVSVSYGVNS
jgi:cytoskeletal protein RodZ